MSCRSVLDLGGDGSFRRLTLTKQRQKRGGRRGREGFYSGADSDIDRMTGKAMTRKRIRIRVRVRVRVRGEEGCEKKKELEPSL